jgi:alpha-beta hydrolase superfamily lysophospholipase
MTQPVSARSHKLSAADGTALHVTDYLLPAAEARASIVIMHGLGEHSGRYRHVAAFLNECGLSVRCYDHRGHGRSDGIRGDVTNGSPMLQDAEIVVDDFAAHFDRPPFLLGHSMGGLFAARFALAGRSRLRGLVLSSPALAVNLSPLQRRLLDIMHAIVPSFGVANGLPLPYLSHDAAVVAAYKADPLVHNKISARLMRAMLAAIGDCQTQAGTLAVPVLMLVAGDDHLVDAAGSKRFFSALAPGLATMHLYEGFYHEVFNEPDAARPFADLRAWLFAQEAL